jgi:hypothetical protein
MAPMVPWPMLHMKTILRCLALSTPGCLIFPTLTGRTISSTSNLLNHLNQFDPRQPGF